MEIKLSRVEKYAPLRAQIEKENELNNALNEIYSRLEGLEASIIDLDEQVGELGSIVYNDDPCEHCDLDDYADEVEEENAKLKEEIEALRLLLGCYQSLVRNILGNPYENLK